MTNILWIIIRSQAFRRIELQQLMNLTARAFEKPSQRVWILSNDKALAAYATYTRQHLTDVPSDGLLQRMNDEAFKTGQRLRCLFGLRRQQDVERFIIELYRHIGITLDAHLPGKLCFHRCFFSHYYTPTVCQLASALDEGLIRGLVGEGQLCFQKRITEGYKNCIATYK